MIKTTDIVERLGVALQTVHNWIDKGLLPAYKISGTVLIKEEDYDKFLKEHYTKKDI